MSNDAQLLIILGTAISVLAIAGRNLVGQQGKVNTELVDLLKTFVTENTKLVESIAKLERVFRERTYIEDSYEINRQNNHTEIIGRLDSIAKKVDTLVKGEVYDGDN